MSKVLHQSLTSILVLLVLFGTQLLLAQQSSTPTHFRPSMPKRLLESLGCPTREGSCEVRESLDDSQETYNVRINKNSTLNLEIAFDDQDEIIVDFIFGYYQNVSASIKVYTTKSNKGAISVAADSNSHSSIPITFADRNSATNKLIIALMNPYASTVSVSVTIGEPVDDSLAPWIIPVVVVGGILLVIITFSMIYIWLRKRRERRQLQWIYSGNFYGEAQPNQVTAESEEFNLERDLDKMFPEAKNSKFKSSFPQKTCTICLEDFQEDQPCRQLQCQHVFHTECIKLWLGSQAEKKLKVFCPNCHKEIVKPEKKKSKV